MKFEEAIECLKAGERIKRSHWKSAYLRMVAGKVKMQMGFRKPWYYNFKNHDIVANDWLIYTDHMFTDDEDYAKLQPLTGNLNFRSNN